MTWVRGHVPRQFHCSRLLNMVPGQWKRWPIFFKNSKWVDDPPPPHPPPNTVSLKRNIGNCWRFLKEEILCLFLTLNYSGERADGTFYSSTLVFVIQGSGLVLWSEFSRYGLSVIMILSLPRQVLLTDCCAFVVLVSVLFFVCFLSCKFFCRSRLDKYNVLWLWFSSLIFPFAISSVQPTFSHEDRSLVNLLCPKIQIIIFFLLQNQTQAHRIFFICT